MWPPRIEVALDRLSFDFDEAVEIVRRDVDETLSSLVCKVNRVRKDFPRDD
jgi:Ethanolamine utilization protein EutJ (predicted chaperonin)